MNNKYTITFHLVKRYEERRKSVNTLEELALDLSRDKPLTKNRMRKLNIVPRSGHKLLVTPDRFVFVIDKDGKSLITCYKWTHS